MHEVTLAEQPEEGLRIDSISVRFGGLLAVDGVSLSAPLGQITGLIGPNGAGKTTTFNVCSGLIRPTLGSVHLLGHDVTLASPQARGQRGLGRTFQRMELFDSISVRANVALGKEAAFAGSKPWRHLRGTRAESRSLDRAVAEALAMCDIPELADRRPADLSTGQRRLVELARCIAGGFRVMLLDEPSSGLDKVETARFGEILRSLVEQRRVGILIVEHDMSLVMRLCDYIHVLDFGKPVFDGTPAEVASSNIVRAAYLGSEEVEGATASAVGGR
jgi:ABC-type branched-subunit amino acid transport system ATPase component